MRLGYEDLEVRSDSGYLDFGTRHKRIGSMMMGLINAFRENIEIDGGIIATSFEL
ncbi:MAG: hypothetical protein K9N21_19660 [Deltaproteobacteria bacterium]|nr:hypothetical protein [Deltaproteobacteria bacterium]